jgi:SAM-dependent methyltransferase
MEALLRAALSSRGSSGLSAITEEQRTGAPGLVAMMDPGGPDKNGPAMVLSDKMPDGVEFDQIAPVYDETRRPPSKEELETLAELFTGCRTILDAGVGTGRFAVPLRAQGFEVVGVDVSLGMMRRARVKGISTLVRADVRRLPFFDKVVDAAFMAHVLQLIPDPRPVLKELGRVACQAVVIQLPAWSQGDRTNAWIELRGRYRELAAELGYPLAMRGKRYRHSLDELSAIAPPKAVRVVTGPPPSAFAIEERFARWETQAFGRGRVPPEVHAEIVRRLRAERPIDPSAWTRPHEVRFVAWDPTNIERTA